MSFVEVSEFQIYQCGVKGSIYWSKEEISVAWRLKRQKQAQNLAEHISSGSGEERGAREGDREEVVRVKKEESE